MKTAVEELSVASSQRQTGQGLERYRVQPASVRCLSCFLPSAATPSPPPWSVGTSAGRLGWPVCRTSRRSDCAPTHHQTWTSGMPTDIQMLFDDQKSLPAVVCAGQQSWKRLGSPETWTGMKDGIGSGLRERRSCQSSEECLERVACDVG